MKKLFYIGALSALLLAACGGEEATPKGDTPAVQTNAEVEEKSDAPTQEELNAQLKEEATAIDFVAANAGEVPKDAKVTLKGVVKVIFSEGVAGKFSFTTTEDNGYGAYTIVNLSMTEPVEGNEVTIYGTFDGKDESGIPQIVAIIIE